MNKNLYAWLFLFVWSIFSFSCSHVSTIENKVHPQTYFLTSDTISIYPYRFANTILLKNNILLLINPMDAGEVHVINTQTRQMAKYSINDSLQVLYPATFPISFFQFGMRSYFHYELINNSLVSSKQNFRLHGQVINKAEWIDRNKYITLGFFRTGLFGLYDKTTKRMNYYGHYPIPIDIPYERNAMEKIVQQFQGSIAYSAKHSKIVYCSDDFAYLSCYYFTGSKIKFQWEKHIIPPPKATIINGFIELDKTVTRGGFSDVTIAGDYIFTSYTQKNVTDSISTVMHSIMVYDMEGCPIVTYHIDCPLSTIAVDLQEKIIYGISKAGESVIVRFNFSI